MSTPLRPYLTTLTPLRGMAALLIVVFHSYRHLVEFVPRGSTYFFSNTYFWVDFFFILSGFVMSYVYGENFNRNVSRAKFKAFIGARFARIYPLHLFTLCWGIIIAVVIHQLANRIDPIPAALFDLKGIPAALLLIHGLNLYMVAPLSGVAWSLSTEWWVYFIFPFIAPLLTIHRPILKIAIGAGLLAAYLLVMYYLGPVSRPYGLPKLNMTADYGIVRCLIGFITGMFMFVLYQSQTGRSLLKKDWCFLCILCGIFISSHLGLNDVFIVFLMSLLLLSAAYNTTAVKRILDKRPFQRLGDWSFSIYMVHVLIIFMFYPIFLLEDPDILYNLDALADKTPDYQTGLIMALIVVTLTLIVSALTYRFIELPGRNFLNRVFKNRRKKVTSQSLNV